MEQIIIPAITAIITTIIVVSVPLIFGKKKSDTEIMENLQALTSQAVEDVRRSEEKRLADNARFSKRISDLEAQVEQRMQPIRIIFDVETQPHPDARVVSVESIPLRQVAP